MLNDISQAHLNRGSLISLYTLLMKLGTRLIQLRRHYKKSQEEIGGYCGVTKSSVSQWESDSTVPDLSKILLLREHLDFSLDWLLMGKGDMIGGMYVENERLKCLLSLAEPLPSYALDHVIQDVAETAKLIEKAGENQAANLTTMTPSSKYSLPPRVSSEGARQPVKTKKVHTK